MPHFDDPESTSQPGREYNARDLPLPEGHEQQTPEFLQKLLDELKRIQDEQDENFRKMYPPVRSIGSESSPPRPRYEVLQEYQDKDVELDRKASAIKQQIQYLRVLIAQQTQEPKPELTEAMKPETPADPATQAEVLKGPNFPVQRPSGGGEVIEVG